MVNVKLLSISFFFSGTVQYFIVYSVNSLLFYLYIIVIIDIKR